MPQSGPECHVLRQRADFDTLIWQQDGFVKDFLAEEFGNNRIWSLDFPIEWPPRSPNLSAMDFCINNEVKGKSETITHMGPRTNDDVFVFSAIAWNQLAPQTIRRTCEDIIRHPGPGSTLCRLHMRRRDVR